MEEYIKKQLNESYNDELNRLFAEWKASYPADADADSYFCEDGLVVKYKDENSGYDINEQWEKSPRKIMFLLKDCPDEWRYDTRRLLVGYERTARGHLVSATQNKSGGSGDSSYESHNHSIDNDYTENFIYTDTLKVGDWVSILPCEGAEGQLYIINEEVVKLE